MTIHLFATMLIVVGAKQFSSLSDLDLVKAFSEYGNDMKEALSHLTSTNKFDTFGQRLSSFYLWTFYSALIGLVISFIISLTIGCRKKVFWVNSLIVFIVAFCIFRIGFFRIPIVKDIVNWFGDLFINFGIEYTYIINGLLWTSIGLLMFFNKWTNKYIYNTNEDEHQSIT